MTDICPTVTAFDLHQYRTQLEMIEGFAKRVHIDLMDGDFTPTESPPIESIWLSDKLINDVHLMYRRPEDHLQKIIELKPSLLVVHFEADLNYADFAHELRKAGIRSGLCVMPGSDIEAYLGALQNYDHSLIFSGSLGRHGGVVDPNQIHLIDKVKALYPEIEVGWDGGINDENAPTFIKAGYGVLNVGGFIHKAEDPSSAYAKLEVLTKA
jgi:ribulose-phosphate 3-epimerase